MIIGKNAGDGSIGMVVLCSELYISLWNDNIQSSKQKKNEASIPVFDSDWTSVSVPQTSEFMRIGRQFHALSANHYTAGIILLASLFAAGYRSRYRKYRVHWFCNDDDQMMMMMIR